MNEDTQSLYYKKAGFVVRVVAALIDGLLISVIALPFSLILDNIAGESFSIDKGSNFRFIAGCFIIIYNVAFVYLYGATLGKKLLNIKVVNLNYQKLSFWQALVRETIGQLLSGIVFSLGYVWVAIDEKKQAWHDKLARTYVIYTQPIAQEEYLKIQSNKLGSLPYILGLAGLGQLLFILTMHFTLGRTLTYFADSNLRDYSYTWTYTILVAAGLLAVIQIALGIGLKVMNQKAGAVAIRTGKIILIIGLFAFSFLIPYLILSIIMPIYRLTTSID